MAYGEGEPKNAGAAPVSAGASPAAESPLAPVADPAPSAPASGAFAESPLPDALVPSIRLTSSWMTRRSPSEVFVPGPGPARQRLIAVEPVDRLDERPDRPDIALGHLLRRDPQRPAEPVDLHMRMGHAFDRVAILQIFRDDLAETRRSVSPSSRATSS